MTLACNPELTLLTNMAASSPIVGGTSMALAESCVMIGSEGGKILRCHPRKKNIKKLFAGSDSNIHWDKSAIDFFDNLPPCITSKLIKHVELWANSVSRQVVSAKDIFAARQQNDLAQTVFETYCEIAALALSGVINTIDPHCVVLGGGLSNVPGLCDEIASRWQRYIFSDQIDTRMLCAKHGDASGVRGAAWLW